MDLQSLTLFKMANEKMEWVAQRQSVLAENIANSTTPDYVSHDIKALDFSKELAKANSVTLATTNENHIQNAGTASVSAVKTNSKHLSGTLSGKGSSRVDADRSPYELSIDKNGVDIEEQMAKIGRNQQDYEISATIYTKYNNMIKTSLGKGK
ncbi:MAG: flagellar basal body rod protein FlgB [Alphaproteobacteria bacterium]